MQDTIFIVIFALGGDHFEYDFHTWHTQKEPKTSFRKDFLGLVKSFQLHKLVID